MEVNKCVLNRLIELGDAQNITFLRYYRNLESTFVTSVNCQGKLAASFFEQYKKKIIEAEIDNNSKLGVYYKINPNLTPPQQEIYQLETERIITTRYRCGSHNLKIESGRMCNPPIPREDRVCACLTGIQTLEHCLFYCPLMVNLYEDYHFKSMEEAMRSERIASFLTKMEKYLHVS